MNYLDSLIILLGGYLRRNEFVNTHLALRIFYSIINQRKRALTAKIIYTHYS